MSGRRTDIAFSPGAAGPVTGGDIIVSLVHDGFDIGTNDNEPELGWQDRALCAQTDPEAFFPEKGGSTREAKRVCRTCEVRAECLEYALDHDERFGIWGGLSERERRQLKRSGIDELPAQPAEDESADGPPLAEVERIITLAEAHDTPLDAA